MPPPGVEPGFTARRGGPVKPRNEHRPRVGCPRALIAGGRHRTAAAKPRPSDSHALAGSRAVLRGAVPACAVLPFARHGRIVGGVQAPGAPSSIPAIAASSVPYRRMISWNGPPAPAASCPVRLRRSALRSGGRCSASRLLRTAGSSGRRRVAFQRVGDEEAARRHTSSSTRTPAPAPGSRSPGSARHSACSPRSSGTPCAFGLRDRVDRDVRRQCPQPDLVGDRPQRVIGAVVARPAPPASRCARSNPAWNISVSSFVTCPGPAATARAGRRPCPRSACALLAGNLPGPMPTLFSSFELGRVGRRRLELLQCRSERSSSRSIGSSPACVPGTLYSIGRRDFLFGRRRLVVEAFLLPAVQRHELRFGLDRDRVRQVFLAFHDRPLRRSTTRLIGRVDHLHALDFFHAFVALAGRRSRSCRARASPRRLRRCWRSFRCTASSAGRR